ncbi:orotate phosphoribosyltransferase [Candidatus Auribacterota bacterium]
MYTEQEIVDIFKKYEALCEGHFLLSSGKHSAKYLQCALVLKEPKIAEKLGNALALKFKDEKIDKVVGPAMGGIIIAHEVARALNVPALFSEREQGEMTFRRGFSLKEGERILVVEDVITTGLSVREVITVIQRQQALVVGVGSLIDRGEGVDFSVTKKSLCTLEVATYESEKCPLCKDNIPVIKPGSRKIS